MIKSTFVVYNHGSRSSSPGYVGYSSIKDQARCAMVNKLPLLQCGEDETIL